MPTIEIPDELLRDFIDFIAGDEDSCKWESLYKNLFEQFISEHIVLQPCPFHPTTQQDLLPISPFDDYNSWPGIRCNICGAVGPASDGTMMGAVRVWNERESPTGDGACRWCGLINTEPCYDDDGHFVQCISCFGSGPSADSEGAAEVAWHEGYEVK